MQERNQFVLRDRSTKPGKTYTYRVVILDVDNVVTSFETTITTPVLVLTLNQNFPNPFNPTTTISFVLPEETFVSLSVYDAGGRMVVNLVNETLSAGYKTIVWDGKNADGRTLTTGVYFYQLKTGKNVLTKKMLLLK